MRLRSLMGVGLATLAMTAASDARATGERYGGKDGSTVEIRSCFHAGRQVQSAIDHGAKRIVFKRACIVLGPLGIWDGDDTLSIDGNGTIVKPWGYHVGFTSTRGGDLALKDLAFVGGMHGVLVTLPPDATRTPTVALDRIAVLKADRHGVYLDDIHARTIALSPEVAQTIKDELSEAGDTRLDDALASGMLSDDDLNALVTELSEDGEIALLAGVTESGSEAGFRLLLTDSKIADNGYTRQDQDGIRVDERDGGGIYASFTGTWIVRNSSDGAELDEAGPGDVTAVAKNTHFDENGPNPVKPADTDDGLDIDEADAGDVWVILVGGTVAGNLDEGYDIDESGPGGIIAKVHGTAFTDNRDDGFKLSESDAGPVFASVHGATSTGNGGHGFQAEETGEGDNDFKVDHSQAVDNESDGVNGSEEDEGNLTMAVTNSTVTGNDDDGVQADESGPGSGSLDTTGSDISGNGDDDINDGT